MNKAFVNLQLDDGNRALTPISEKQPLEESGMSGLDNAFGISAQALIFRSQRSGVLAANIANAETPQYFAKDYDFSAALSAASAQFDVKPAVSDARHIGSGPDDDFGGTLYRVPTKASSNGNTVEEEIEQAAFSANAVRYQTSLQFLNGSIRGLRLAIKGE
jgi:flagellar basal-body rod protein FlgB